MEAAHAACKGKRRFAITDMYRFFCGTVAHHNALHIPCNSRRLTEKNEQRKYASVQWVVL